MTPHDHDDAKGSPEPNHEGQAAGRGLSERGISAMQGTSAEKVNSGQKGSDFEQWGRAEVFKGESHRLTALPEDNEHLDEYGDGLGLTKRRSSDSYVDEEGSLWDLKSGYEKGGIDEDQLLEYSMMEDAGHVFIRDDKGQIKDVPVTSINYLFETKAGAAANATDLQGRATAWYKDENGKVQLYDDEKPAG
jgi:hypothetical protein